MAKLKKNELRIWSVYRSLLRIESDLRTVQQRLLEEGFPNEASDVGDMSDAMEETSNRLQARLRGKVLSDEPRLF